MSKILLTIITVKKFLLIISAFLFTWLIQSFEIFMNLKKVLEYTLFVIMNRYYEICVTVFFVGILYIILTYCINVYRKKSISKPKLNLKSNIKVSNIIQQNDKLCNDNSVFLTRFKIDGQKLYIVHLLYSLLIYYKDPINLFFLTIAFGQVYMFNDYRSLIPLVIFSIMAMIQYFTEIKLSIAQQLEINDKNTFVINKGISTIIKQKNIKRGDLIKLNYTQDIPADILLLGQQKVTVNELDLTGENLDIQKSGLNVDINNLHNYNLSINHHLNNGMFDNKMYSHENIIYRGTKMIDGNIFGIVIETGNDCQIYRLDYDMIRSKTMIETIMGNICMQNLYLLIGLAVICGTIVIHKTEKSYNFRETVKSLSTFILLFNTMIPLSLQFFYNSSSKIISKRIQEKFNVKINTHGNRSFQYDPYFIVTDKTGTLTTNDIKLDSYYVEDKYPIENMMTNIISCSSIDLHSVTKELMKNDVLEERLLNYMFENYDCKLLSNHLTENIGSAEFKLDNQIFKINRLYYKSFIHDTNIGAKISIIKSNNQLIMHIQGMPEAILKFLKPINSSRMDKKLHDIESFHNHNEPYYKRIIGHASKIITEDYLNEFLNSNDKSKFMSDFENWSIYVFHDYVIDGIKSIVTNFNKNLSMLTGDKFSSALNVGKTIGLLNNNYVHIEQDISYKITENDCVVISGSFLQELINNNSNNLINAILSTNRHIIYRATPNIKQLYVSFLQSSFHKTVMMIGDGSNDISSIIKADVGIGIIGENKTIQKISDIVVKDWKVVPKLLEEFRKRQLIINNVCQWIIMKHMLSAFTLFGMLISSFYDQVRDPSSPLLTTFMNAVLFLYMMKYSYYEEISNVYSNISIRKWYLDGLLLGILNGIYVFSVVNYNNGIYLAISSIILQLVLKMYNFDSNKKILNKIFYCFTCSIILYVLYYLSTLSYDIYIGYLLLSTLLFKIIDYINF